VKGDNAVHAAAHFHGAPHVSCEKKG